MKNFVSEFKEFAIKGNVIELATAVVIGTAFGRIVTSLVNNIIMPLIGVLSGGINFNDKMVVVGDAQISYGIFVQSIIEFVIVALSIFVFLKTFNVLRAKIRLFEEEKKEAAPKAPPEEIVLLREIRDSLKRS